MRLMQARLRLEAPGSFPHYLSYSDTSYRLEWFHKIIAENCQMLLEGKIQNLMLFVPPQHGKSEIVSRKFPSWALGNNPDLKIVACSYSADLSEQFSRSVQRTIESPEYQRIFPGTFLSSSQKAKDPRSYVKNIGFFETVGHKGFYKAVGIGGSLTGTPADIGIIDDPVKDAMEAYSPVVRERVWNWYTDVFLTRLHNNSKQLFIMTRWHDDDLAGRILQKEADKWRVIKIPAIREDNLFPEDPREIGEALWPQMHSLERLRDAEKRSPRTFAALYQQRPSIEGGNIIKRDWFKHIKVSDFNRIYNGEAMVFFLDTAYTDKTHDDPSGIIATCKIGAGLYVTHAKKVLMRFPDLIRFIPSYVKEHGYTTRSSVRIEPKANGISVIDQLKEISSLNVVSTPSPKDSKETRLYAVSPTIEAGHVVLVDGAWNEEFEDEVCGFPAKPHDEYVDILGYAINYHISNPFKPIDKAATAKKVY